MNIRTVILTSLSLLLAACGSSSTPTSSTTAPAASSPATPVATAPVSRPGAIYEVTFQGVNGSSGAVTASTRFLGGVSALGLANAPDTLSFTRLSSETFVTDADHVRHVKATFKVTNTGTAAIDGLTLVPVDTDDADSDPSNNSTAPTVGTTPFSKVRYYDGSDASARAADLTPTGGKRFNASTGLAETDPNDSAFLTNQDVSGLSATPPAGLVIAGFKTYGWKVSDSLAPGASANVTFATDLPAAADSKNDPFSFSLVFTNAQAGPTPIHDIQGNGSASPLNGKNVVTEGIVTADYQASGQLGGFFIQAPDAQADNDPATSEGLFVLCNTSCKDVNVGDSVRVSGTATEFNTLTELNAVTAVTVQSSGNALPTPVQITLPVGTVGDWEKVEGMRVHVQGVVTENYKLGRGGVVKVADAKIPSYTQVNAPSTSGYAAYVAAIARRTIPVDDGSTAQNPASVYGRGNQPLSAANTLRTGDSADVTGVVYYGFDYTGTPDTYRIESTAADANFTGPVRPPAPSVTGNVTVASANVLNFFTTLATSNADADNGGAACTPDGVDATNSRGANDCFEYKRQLAKVAHNLAGLNADVIGLMEVQNNTTVGTSGNSLSAIVDAVNALLGGPVYAAIAHPNPGTDAIRVAMIYKTASVTPVGAPLTDTDPVNNRFPLAQVFQASGGRQFAVVVNHLKSKGSAADSDPRNVDQLDGQGASPYRREQQVARLLDLIQNQIVVGRGVSDVIAVGDFNAYNHETSLQNLQKGLDGVAGTADDLTPVFDDSTYSYQFDSQFGNLDHAFVTQSLSTKGVNGDKWHDNSDEPTVLDYNKEFKTAAQVGTTAAPGTFFDDSAYRSSDHDPLKVGFTLPALATLSVTPSGDATAYAGQTYTLNTPTTGTPDTLDIDWGDGTTEPGLPGTTSSRTHVYSTPGPVTITVTAHRGSETASGTQSVTVSTSSIQLSAANASRDVYTTGTSTTSSNGLTLSRTGYSGAVTVSASVSGGSTPPTLTVTQPGTGNSGSVAIDGSGATPGSYTVTLTASGSGVASSSTSFTVNVKAVTSPSHLVISQVYGAGGNTGASYTTDYVELFNPSTAALSLNGYSLQYAGATSTAAVAAINTLALPNAVVLPGHYYLVQLASGANGSPLPVTADFVPTSNVLNLSGASGKLALVGSTTPIAATVGNVTTTSHPTVVDFLGYGTANGYETTASAVLTATTAAVRAGAGCTDTNTNSADFSVQTVNSAITPRNSATTPVTCP